MAAVRPRPPRVEPPDLPAELTEHTGLLRHGQLSGRRIGEVIGTTDATGIDLSECELDQARGDRLILTDAQLSDVEITQPTCVEILARGARLHRTRVTGGRIGTLDLSGAVLDQVELRDLRIDYLSFARAELGDVLITNCTVTALDLPEARLQRVAVADSRIDELTTRGIRAHDVDLRGAEVARLLDPDSLRGLTFTPFQMSLHAEDLGRALGVDVRDDGDDPASKTGRSPR